MCACEVNRESAEQVCDEKNVEWLVNRKKHAAHKRKRTHRSARAPSPAPACVFRNTLSDFRDMMEV